MSVEGELKSQAPAPPFKIFFFRLWPCKIAWPPAPQPWVKLHTICF